MKIRRCMVLILAVALLLVPLPTSALADSTDTVYVRKHISLLYDNSGSMSMALDGVDNLKWSYASYAAQMFAGLLNDTDTLSFTFMNKTNSIRKLEVDLSADRQSQVDKILKATNYAKGDTPIGSIDEAKQALVSKGLQSDSQIGTDPIDKSQQYWLVLTTDGNFRNVTEEEMVARLESLLKEYSNLQVVYFGIGTEGDQSDDAALDFRGNKTLTSYPNFTAVYAERQDQILATMQALANRISGRYSVSSGLEYNGNTVTIRVSGETCPIRNIALLAQNTNATLVRATTENGKQLTVSRTASIQYPQNSSYNSMPADTKGGHTALITCSEGKIPPGTIVLEFSEPVDKNNFSLMYEPAIYVDLTLQYQDEAGNWVDVPYGQEVLAEQNLRINYVIYEDGTNTPIDPSRLPGTTTARIVYGDTAVEPGQAFRLPEGNTTIRAEISMMDGAYVVSAVRNVTVYSLAAYSFQVSDPLEFYPDELAENTGAYIEITVLYQGKTPDADRLADLRLDAGDLQGQITNPSAGVYRFTPKQTDCPVGTYAIRLLLLDRVVASQNVLVKESVITYSAQAGEPLALFNNELTANTTPIIFHVTRHRDEEAIPLAQADAADFRIEAISATGLRLEGQVSYQPDGQLHFVPNDANGAVGDYSVILYWKDQELARSNVTVMQYNAVFSIEVFHTGDETVNRLNLRKNQNGLAFIVRADGVAVSAAQLEAMLGNQLVLSYTPHKNYMQMDVQVGEYQGQPALIVTPASTYRTGFGALIRKPIIALRSWVKETLAVTLTVEAVHRATATGELELRNNPVEALICLLVPLVLLALLYVIGRLIWCGITMPRITPGTFYYFHVRVGDRAMVLESPPENRHKRREYLRWKPDPEKLTYKGMTFVADENCRGRDSSPSCVLDKNDPNLHNYYVEYFSLNDDLLKLLRDAGSIPFPKRELNKLLTKSVVTQNQEEPTAEHIYLPIGRGGYVMKKIRDTVSDDQWDIYIWMYY